MKKILFFLFLPICFVYGQKQDIIFRIALESHDAVGYSYNINILTLSENKEYNLIEQKYVSKKFARKNIPSKFSKTYGIWNVKNDTLKLIDNENKKEISFIRKKNYLVYLFNNQEMSKFHWIKVNR